MNDEISFGTWLKRRRKAAGLTQENLAQQTGCSTVTIKKIESDDLQASVQLAELIAIRLAIAPEERAAFVRWARGGAIPPLSSISNEIPWRAPATPPYAPRRRSNLPAQLTGMVGREKEVAAGCALLRQRNVRMLTLSGPPGIGKTRLSIQVALELLNDFTDGVCFVPLSTVPDASLVASAVAQALGVRELPGQALLTTLQEYLCDKHLLLLLDNFEQVIAAAPVVKDVLTAAPRVKVMITSREVLHLYGEQEFPVPPLALPNIQHPPPVEALSLYPAVALFIQRAQAAKPDFILTAENAQSIIEICACLDGLPLAIEMAAARAKWLSPRALLARLSQRLALLTSGPRDLSARQQTLRGAIDWSYDLLDPWERKLFARFAVFANSATIDMAQDVLDLDVARHACADTDVPVGRGHAQVQAGLRSLADKSLLRVTLSDDSDAAPRFTMLATLREYARDKLEESGELDVMRNCHLAHYLAWAEQVEPKLHGPDQIAWLAHLDAEHDNLRAALDWATESGAINLEAELRLAGALGWFWRVRGHLTEGLERLRSVLERSSHLGRTASRARALSAAGLLAYYRVDYPLALAFFDESAVISRANHDPVNLAYALHGLGNVCWFKGNQARARALLEESVAMYREQPESWASAMVLSSLARVLGYQGDYAASQALFQESLDISARIGDKWCAAFSLWSLGDVTYAQGDYDGARVLYEKGLPLARELGDKPNIAYVLARLADYALQQQDYARLRAISHEALALFRELGDKWQRPYLLRMLGYAALHEHDFLQATALCRESLLLNHELNDARGVIASIVALGCIGVVEGSEASLQDAVRLFSAAQSLLQTHDIHLLKPDAESYLRSLSRARAQFPIPLFEAAWGAGASMTYEQAVANALKTSSI